MADTSPTIYLHIGPPKTGTTYLQDVMWRNRQLLHDRGIALPGASPEDHFLAALDLRQLRFGGYDRPEAVGAWGRVVSRALRSTASTVVISHEIFAGAAETQIQRAVRSLSPKVHVVYAARDLARQLPAVWQETLKNRRSRPYGQFLTTTLDRRSRPDEARGFWRGQNPVETLRRWSTAVPADRIHVVTLPQPPAPPGTLWTRFCAVLQTSPDGFDTEVARANSSLSPVQAEMLRRLNKALPDDLPWPAYERLVKQRFNQLGEARPSQPRLLVPDRYRDAVLARTDSIREDLARAGYDIIGGLDELVPDDSSFGSVPRPAHRRVADASVDLLATVLTEQAAAHSRPRRWARRLSGQVRRLRGAQ
ncbi:MAG: hypothetical protein ACRDQA_05885 [Nocardioidaceae bacterium]